MARRRRTNPVRAWFCNLLFRAGRHATAAKPLRALRKGFAGEPFEAPISAVDGQNSGARTRNTAAPAAQAGQCAATTPRVR